MTQKAHDSTLPKKKAASAPSAASVRVKNGSSSQGPSAETHRRAAAVLEVLAGLRTPSEAATALGLTANYYYVLERKALAGLVAACAPQPPAPPGPSCEQQLARAEQELEKCRQECLRQASLVRATERALGLSAVPPPPGRGKAKPGNGRAKTRRRRRPTVRALRAAEALRKNSSLDSSPAEVKPPVDGRVDPTTCVATDKESSDGTQGPQAPGGGTC